MRKNHLIEPIQCILEAATAPLSEYDLISQLQQQEWLARIDSANTVSLYSAHFLVYNALFQLHAYYLERHQYLTISALTIRLDGASNLDTGDEGSEAQFVEAQFFGKQPSGIPSSEVLPKNLETDSRYNQADISSLRDYYLDWDNLENATKDSVDELLNSFWDRFVNDDDYSDALAVLQLSKESKAVDYRQVKTAYQRLAMKYHPDRGGDVERFQRINWAFSVLRRAL